MPLRKEILANPHLAATAGISSLVNVIEGVLEHIQQESIAQHQSALYNMVDLLTPLPFNRLAPAFGLARFNTNQSFNLEEGHLCTVRLGEKTFSFSPVYTGNCLPLSMRIICANGKWWDVREKGLGPVHQLDDYKESVLYLGLEVHTEKEDISSLDGLQLYFQGVQDRYLPLLSFLEVSYQGQAYEFSTAKLVLSENYLDRYHCDREFLHVHDNRNYIANRTTEKGLMRLVATGNRASFSNNIPSGLVAQIPEEAQSKLVWIKCTIPESIPPESFLDCTITTNVFPLWDVVKEEIRGNLNGKQELIIPLRQHLGNNSFFALDRIWNLSQHPYKSRELFPDQTGTYRLGCLDTKQVGAIDLSKLLRVLEFKINQMGLGVLARYPNNEYEIIQPYLKEIGNFNKRWTDIRSKLRQVERKDYYLEIFPSTGDDIVYINFYTTQDVRQQMWSKEFLLTCDALKNSEITMVLPPQVGRLIKNIPDRIADLQGRLFPSVKAFKHEG